MKYRLSGLFFLLVGAGPVSWGSPAGGGGSWSCKPGVEGRSSCTYRPAPRPQAPKPPAIPKPTLPKPAQVAPPPTRSVARVPQPSSRLGGLGSRGGVGTIPTPITHGKAESPPGTADSSLAKAEALFRSGERAREVPNPSAQQMGSAEDPSALQELEAIERTLLDLKPETPERELSREYGLSAVKEGKEAYQEGDREGGMFFGELASTFLSLASGFFTPSAFVQSVYELWTGKDLFSQRELADWERGFSALGVLTLGTSGFVRSSVQATGRIAIRCSKFIRSTPASQEAIREAIGVLNAMKPGETIAPLREVVSWLGRNGKTLTHDQRRKIITAFQDGSRLRVLEEDLPVYRYYREGGWPRSNWVTTQLYDNPVEALALQHEGQYQVRQWTLRKGTKVLDGRVAPNFGRPGGGHQLWIADFNALE